MKLTLHSIPVKSDFNTIIQIKFNKLILALTMMMGVVCMGQNSFTFPTLADNEAIEVWDGEVTVDVNTAGVPSGVYDEIEVTAIWDGSGDFPEFSRCSVSTPASAIPYQLGVGPPGSREPNTITPVGSQYEITFTGNISYEPEVDDKLELVLEQDNGIQGLNVTAYWSDIEVTVFKQPDCQPPIFSTSSSSVTNITTISADLSWIETQVDIDGYEWVVMPSGDAPDTTTAVATGTVNYPATDASITGLSENTSYDAFVRADCGSDGLSEWSDAENFLTLANCLRPENLSVSNITSNSIVAEWDEVTGASNGYEAFVFTAGDNPSESTPVISEAVNSSMTNLTINGLSQNTTYDLYVKADCDADGMSDFSDVVNFTTLCEVKAPFTENFNTNTQDIPECWTQGENNTQDWSFNDTPINDIGEGGSFPNTSASGGGFAWVNDGNSTSIARLETPYIDASSLINPALSFYFISNSQGFDNVQFSVEVWDGSAWNEVFYSEEDSAEGTWESIVLDLSNLTITDNIQVAFIVNENNGIDSKDDIAIDDVSIDEAPSCIKPLELKASNILNSSANLSWNPSASSPSSGYDYVLVTDGSIPDQTTTPTGNVSQGATNVNLTDLNPNTAYDAFVRADCGNGDKSDWSNVVNFQTLCDAFNIPFSEDFDDTSEGGKFSPNAPECWSFIKTDGSGYTYVRFTTSNSQSGSQSYRMSNGSDLSGDYMLVSPEIKELTTDGIQVNFSVKGNSGQLLEIGTMADPTDASTFTVLQTETLSTFDFMDIEVNISATTNSYFAVRHGLSDTFEDFYLDDFTFSELPTCIEPQNLSVSNITTSAELTWDAEVDATSYDWVIMASGDDPEVSTPKASADGVTTLSDTVTNLEEVTTYDAYVRSNCGDGDLSSWSEVASFTTTCNTFVAPYNNSFESFPETQSIGQEDCWSAYGETNYSWNATSNETPSDGTGPNGAEGGNLYIFTEASAASPGDEAFFESPPIDISDLTNPHLFFFYHMYGSDMGILKVEINNMDGSGYTEEFNLLGEQQSEGSEPWTEQSIDLSAYNDTILIRFIGVRGNGFSSDMAIDNIRVDALSCPSPTGFSSSSITSTSVDLNWNEVSFASNGYEYVIMESGVALDASTAVATGIVANGTNSISVSGLSNATEYDAYIRSDCGGGDFSNWETVSFTTACDVYTAPFYEDFDSELSSISIPICWSQGFYNQKDWQFTNTPSGNIGDFGSFPNSSASGNGFAWVDDSSPHQSDTRLETPMIDISGLPIPHLSFYFISNSQSSANVDFRVEVWDGTAWNEVFFSNQNSENNAWEEVIINLSNLTITDDIQVAFIVDENNGFDSEDDIAIDDVAVNDGPNCPKPQNISLTNITANSVELNWDDTANGLYGYEWVVMESGELLDTGIAENTGTVPNGTTIASVSNLKELKDYDVYLRTDCGNGEFSDWTDAESFTTPPANDQVENAINLTVNASSSGSDYSNVGATAQTNEPATNFNDGINASVWFTFQAPTYGNTQVTTDITGGTLTNTEIAVYSVENPNDFSSFEEVGFDQDGGSDVDLNSVLNLYDLDKGETYYVQVDRHGTVDSGTFGIEVRDLTYTYNSVDGYQPSNPDGQFLNNHVLIVEDGTASINSFTDLYQIVVESTAVLDINAGISASLLFKSDANGSGQLANVENNIIDGQATVERFIPAGDNNRRAFRFLTSSVTTIDSPIRENWQEDAVSNTDNPHPGYGTHITGSTTDGSNGFDGTDFGNPSLLIFDNASQSWSPIDNTDTNILFAGFPYNLFVRGDRSINLSNSSQTPTNTTLRAKGMLLTGDVDYTSVLATGAGEFSLLGNPYQAIVDFNALTFNGDINPNNLFIWNPNASTQGAYEAIDNAVQSQQVLQPGQSFFVQNSLSLSTPPGLVFTETAKSPSSSNMDVFSTNQITTANLELYNSNDVKLDVVKFRLEAGANNGLDDFDAGKLSNPNENLASENGNTLLSIERRDIPEEEDIVSLHVDQFQENEYKFRLNTTNWNEAIEVYVIDNYLDSETLIKANQNYNFSLDPNTIESIDNNRFSLKFKNITLDINDNTFGTDFKLYPNPSQDGVFNILTHGLSQQKIELKMYNMLGREVWQKTLKVEPHGELKIEATNLSSGVYLVELNKDKQSFKGKLIIK